MKSIEEIKLKISEIEDERQQWIEAQSKYQWTELEKAEGSLRYGILQEKESMCNRKIEILNWVIS